MELIDIMNKRNMDNEFLSQLTFEPLTRMSCPYGHCFFIDEAFRCQSVSVELLKGVIRYAKENNIDIIEAYSTTITAETIADSFAWIGLYKSFERAGFEIVDRTSKNRPMVLYYTNN